MLARWLRYYFPQPLRHVEMFTTADENCKRCAGTGWFRDYTERCLSSCSCVDPKETVLGND